MDHSAHRHEAATGEHARWDVLDRLEHVAGTPIPSGSLRLWSAELNGEILRVDRASAELFAVLSRFRAEIADQDELRVHRTQQLDDAAERLAKELSTLVRSSERLVHSREPKSPIEALAANTLRHDTLAWISDMRALQREHEEWHSSSLQVDIGGPG